MKTRKSVKKRYKVTGSNKLKRRKAFKSHILEKKLPKRKARLSNKIVVKKSDAKVVIRLINGLSLKRNVIEKYKINESNK